MAWQRTCVRLVLRRGGGRHMGGSGGGGASHAPRSRWRLLDMRAARAAPPTLGSRALLLDGLNAHVAPNAARSHAARAHSAEYEVALLSRPGVRGCRIYDSHARSHARGRGKKGMFDAKAFARYYNDS